VFEDDNDGEFQFDAPALSTLRAIDTERVIYVGTFSKSVFPALRLGFIVCPRALREDILKTKALDDWGCPTVEQAALAAFLESRQYERYLRTSLAELKQRRAIVVDGLQQHLGDSVEISGSTGGMHLVVWFRRLSFAALDQLLALAALQGLSLCPIHPYYQELPPRPGLLIGFGGMSRAEFKLTTELLVSCVQ
jgi:GntR family transcriptional regulator/MocR family aminotransferase